MPFMPVFIKVKNWQQTPNNISFKIPSYGEHKNKVDILTSEKYIKAHYQQYIFEIFLWSSIDVLKSSCIVTDSEIVFELTKFAEEDWEKLEADIDKNTKKELRNQVIEEHQKKSEEEKKLKTTQNAELKRVAVREQIKLDTKKHDAINRVKKLVKENALKELQLWEEEKSQKDIIIKEETPKIKHKSKKSNDNSKYKSSNKIPTIRQKQPEVEIMPSIPLPRKRQTINITFTEREFPTPMRESRLEEEEEWLTKQAAARRSAGFDRKDLRPEERNPQWLKAKGDEFFKVKNYLGAISAYSEGINISKDFVDLFINRSAAHYAAGNLQRTIEDCSKALEIMTPPVPANLEMRAKCIARRGAALCKIGHVKPGIEELEAALKLVPNNEVLKQDIERVKEEIRSYIS